MHRGTVVLAELADDGEGGVVVVVGKGIAVGRQAHVVELEGCRIVRLADHVGLLVFV